MYLLRLLLRVVVLLLVLVSSCRGFAPTRQVTPFAAARFFLGSRPSSYSRSTRTTSSVLYYQNETDTRTTATTTANENAVTDHRHRFHRQATNQKHVDAPCILTIHNKRYNLTAWANAHPGGAKVLQKFHHRNATLAFEAADHSAAAYAMLEEFCIRDNNNDDDTEQVGIKVEDDSTTSATETSSIVDSNISSQNHQSSSWRVRRKLFTKEDPIGVHKYLGLFCLVNFIGRYRQMYFGDPAAGLGSRGHPWFAMACLLPHGLLSVSSLIFHTVPKERVVGKPMIWQEYRVHNIIFGLRSVLTAFAASVAITVGQNTRTARHIAVAFSSACVLLANCGADLATQRLRAVDVESTTATMPYWEGCSLQTQWRFKSFYAYCQFMATLACLATSNPAWPFAVLLAIQLASLLMTLVRKGLLSARGYHYGYTASLAVPYLVGLRSMAFAPRDFPVMLVAAFALYQLRKRGVNKYALWIPVVVARLLFGDQFINYSVW